MAGLAGPTGLFPGDRRLRELDLLGNCLPLLNRLIPWERFRPILESVPKAKPKGPGGRKPYDRMLLFKMMVLQQLHNLSDEQTEYQVLDRLSFQRFLGLGRAGQIIDASFVTAPRQRMHRKEREQVNQSVQVIADSAYRSTEAEQMLWQKAYRSRIHEKAQRKRSLTCLMAQSVARQGSIRPKPTKKAKNTGNTQIK